MKILVLVVAGVVLLVLAVVAIGWLLPKGHVVSRSASYQTKPDRLFSLITGPQDWRPDVLRCETVPDANGRELVRETTLDGESIAYELLDRVPPKSIKRRIATDNLPSLRTAKSTTRFSGSYRALFLATRAPWTPTYAPWASQLVRKLRSRINLVGLARRLETRGNGDRIQCQRVYQSFITVCCRGDVLMPLDLGPDRIASALYAEPRFSFDRQDCRRLRRLLPLRLWRLAEEKPDSPG